MQRLTCGAVALAAVLSAFTAQAQTPPATPAAPAAAPAAPAAAPQQDFSKVEVKTTDLGHKTYMLEGAGGNVTFAVAANGVIMVDGEFAPMHDKLKAAIAAVTKQPVRYLINTHFHGDHTGGNAPFAADGVGIAAQENLKKRLEQGTTNGLTGRSTPPVTGAGLPSKTYGRTMKISLRGRTAQLRYIPRAHTDGDTMVWFADANVLATGDVVIMGRYPTIDYANGGGIDGMIAGSDIFLKMTNDNTKIVPGHGRLATRADLAAYREMLATARERIAKLAAEGKSEQDILAAKPLADIDAKLGVQEQSAQDFVRMVYRSLPKRK